MTIGSILKKISLIIAIKSTVASLENWKRVFYL